MNPEIFLDGRVMLWCGDALTVLRTLPSDHFDCCVTSPPYWGLRDYGVDGQLGLEHSLGEHLVAMVSVFREVRRVLKPSGTCWINYGDCYATTVNGRSAKDTKELSDDDRTFRDKPFSTVGPILRYRESYANRNRNSKAKESYRPDAGNHIHAGGYLKPGDLCMIPNRLAIALQDDGWWIKAEIIWGKTNPMPDSNGWTRPSSAHEKIFLCAKSGTSELWRARDTGELSTNPDLAERAIMKTSGEMGARWIRMPYFFDANAVTLPASQNTHARISQDIRHQVGSARANGGTKTNGNMKAVMRSPKQARAGSGIKNNDSFVEATCLVTEDRFLRNYEPAPLTVWPMATEAFSEAHFATFPPELVERCLRAGCPPRGKVLDPFGGAGTTAMVAVSAGRKAALIDLNPEYCQLARARIEAAFMGKDEGARHMVKALGRTEPPGPLFDHAT